MGGRNLKVVPELYCENIEITKKFYVEVFGFTIKYERLEEQFVYFTLDGVDIMVEGINGSGRRWLTDEMQKTFGRGINLQWDVTEIDDLYRRVKNPYRILFIFKWKSKSINALIKLLYKNSLLFKIPMDIYLGFVVIILNIKNDNVSHFFTEHRPV